MSDSGPLPGWVIPVAFIALLVCHLHDHSKLDGERARESYEHEQTAKQLSEARRNIAAARQELEEVKKKYDGLHSGIQRYSDGLTTDEEFAAAVEPYLDPMEYAVYKAPEA